MSPETPSSVAGITVKSGQNLHWREIFGASESLGAGFEEPDAVGDKQNQPRDLTPEDVARAKFGAPKSPDPRLRRGAVRERGKAGGRLSV